MKEFNLSKRILTKQSVYPNLDWIEANDVKEFIRILKIEIVTQEINYSNFIKILNRLAGDKLK